MMLNGESRIDSPIGSDEIGLGITERSRPSFTPWRKDLRHPKRALTSDEKSCPYCGATIAADTGRCKHCGVRLQDPRADHQPCVWAIDRVLERYQGWRLIGTVTAITGIMVAYAPALTENWTKDEKHVVAGSGLVVVGLGLVIVLCGRFATWWRLRKREH